jgi:hypothetical protein
MRLRGVATLIAGTLALGCARNRNEEDAVTLDARYATDGKCPTEAPIAVTATNGAQRTVKSVSFSLQAFESGTSENLARDTRPREWPATVNAGKSVTMCFPVPALKRETHGAMSYRAEKSVVTF